MTSEEKYILSGAKNWNISVKRFNEICDFVRKAANDLRDLNIGETAKYIVSKFDSEKEKIIAVYEYGKLIAASMIIAYYKNIRDERDAIESLIFSVGKDSIEQ